MALFGNKAPRPPRPNPDVHQSVLGSPRSEWFAAEQLLATLREPRLWHESVIEEVRFEDDRLFRKVNVKINSARAGDLESTSGDLFLVLLKPRKLIHSNLVLETEASKARLLSHREHEKLGQWSVLFRFMSVVRLLDQAGVSLPPDAQFWKTANGLVQIPVSDEDVAKTIVATTISNDRLLGWEWPAHPSEELTFWVGRLFALCTELAERYYKIVKIESFAAGPRRVEFSFDQEQEDRLRRGAVPRHVRRAFNSPPGDLIAHAPWARLSDHYEMRMPAIDGYFVYSQRVTHPRTDGSTPQGAEERAPWVGRPRGRTLAPTIFIGDGTRSTKRIYVSVRYFEIPPGSTVKALAAHGFSLVVAIGLTWWSLWHAAGGSADVAALVAALVAIGSSAIDGLTPRAPILNAPLVPRMLLYLQSLWLVLLSLWLFVRGSSPESIVRPGTGNHLADFLTTVDPWIGPLLSAFIAFQFAVLSVQAIRLVRAYTRSAGARRLPDTRELVI